MRARIGRARPAIQAQFENHFDALMTRFRRFMADVDYLVHQPLGIKEGTLLSWAGMRGVVTLAAAQTLPFNTPHRSLIILIAFIVAAGALLLQGGTLSWVVKALGLAGQDTTPEGEWARLQDELAQAAPSEQDPTLSEEQAALIRVKTQRKALLDLRSTGSYTSHSMSAALADLDAQELSIQVHLGEAE
jgi:CPA1 family monovalent cation:H+ antiporter